MTDHNVNSYGHMKLDWIKFRQMALERFQEYEAESAQSLVATSSKLGKLSFFNLYVTILLLF